MRTHAVLPVLIMFGRLCPLQGAGGPADNPATNFAGQRAESIRLMRQSITRQRESVRNQASRGQRSADRDTKAVPTPAGTAECDPIPDADSSPMIAEAASESRLDPELLRAVIHQESAFRPCALSGRGAMGLMQLMP